MNSFWKSLILRLVYTPLLKCSVFLSYVRFKWGLSFQEKDQRKILERLLKKQWMMRPLDTTKMREEDYYPYLRESFPISSYSDWKESIEKEQKGERVLAEKPFLFQPTSGSSHAKKWIPYSASLMEEFQKAIGPWLFDLLKQYPKISQGKQYWSLSWLPEEMRLSGKSNDDLSYFPPFQRWVLNKCLCCPPSVSLAKTMRGSRLATCTYLAACRDLTFIFIWGPTYFLELLEFLYAEKEMIQSFLKKGDWGSLSDDLDGIPSLKSEESADLLEKFSDTMNLEDLKKLWPRLELISCWDTGTSATWALKLRRLFPRARVQGKGLFATEGVVTIPFEGEYLLSYRSHFYEFKCLETHKIMPSWELKEGQRVAPIISSGNGLFRYLLKDELRVVKGKGKAFSLVFQGRIEGLDLVGEKLTEKVAKNVLQILSQKRPLKPISLLGFSGEELKRPFYLALFEGNGPSEEDLDFLSQKGEELLKEHFHYRLARELNQLGHLKVKVLPHAIEFYLNLKKKGGMVEGDIKIDFLTKV